MVQIQHTQMVEVDVHNALVIPELPCIQFAHTSHLVFVLRLCSHFFHDIEMVFQGSVVLLKARLRIKKENKVMDGSRIANSLCPHESSVVHHSRLNQCDISILNASLHSMTSSMSFRIADSTRTLVTVDQLSKFLAVHLDINKGFK